MDEKIYKPVKNKIMELEFKHLAAYLPYGLKGLDYDKKTYLFKGLDKNGYLHWVCNDFLKKIGYDIKPILYPFSSLRKEDFSLFMSLYGLTKSEIIETNVEYLPYGLVNILLSKHIDIYQLIPAGLAIYINTLNE